MAHYIQYKPLGESSVLKDYIEVGSVITLDVIEEGNGAKDTIEFRVTRCADLGSETRLIHGGLLHVSDYWQVEITLHPETPKEDTVKVFLQAPPNYR